MLILPKEVTQNLKRQCEHKRLEVICNLLKENDRVLDVGCGIGTYTSNPLSYLPIHIVAIDNDIETILYARDKNKRENVEFIVSSGEYFHYREHFDVIVCSHVLEHVSNPTWLLLNLKGLLKDSGYLYVGIPNGFGSFEIQNVIPRILCQTDWGRKLVASMMGVGKDTINPNSLHINFFTVGMIKKLLEQTGWRIINQRSDEFLGGIIFDRIFYHFPLLARWNCDIADKLPMTLTNGWAFVCKKES